MTKLCVIGGGPAGLEAAKTAARAGIKVTLLDKGRIGDNIRCAEGFIDSMRFFDEPPAGVRFRVEQVVVEVKETYVVNGDRVNIWMIDRQEWQQYLAQQAVALGVNILENKRIDKSDIGKLQTAYDWVIDASGVPPVSAQAMGFQSWYKENGAITGQYVLEGDFSNLGNKIKLCLEPHYHGYYWIFPKGKDVCGCESANVGIGWFPEKKAKEDQLNIWKELERVLVKEGLEHYPRLRRLGGICPYKMPPQVVFGNLILAGDASGMTSPLHGGGIDLALISGRVAVESIINQEGQKYPENLMKIIGPKLEVEKRIFELWQGFSHDQVDDLFRLIVRDYSSINIKNLFKYPAILLKEMGTITRLWNGLTKGEWNKGIINIERMKNM